MPLSLALMPVLCRYSCLCANLKYVFSVSRRPRLTMPETAYDANTANAYEYLEMWLPSMVADRVWLQSAYAPLQAARCCIFPSSPNWGPNSCLALITTECKQHIIIYVRLESIVVCVVVYVSFCRVGCQQTRLPEKTADYCSFRQTLHDWCVACYKNTLCR
jgi:hypothetical protein